MADTICDLSSGISWRSILYYVRLTDLLGRKFALATVVPWSRITHADFVVALNRRAIPMMFVRSSVRLSVCLGGLALWSHGAL